MSETEIGIHFFAGDTIDVARDLLGKEIQYKGCSGIIVETEAYRDDAASHWVRRPLTGRMLRETFGHIYIFLAYGRYYCLNFTAEKEGAGAVLIRALEPTGGIETIKRRRKTDRLHQLANGPGRLGQAFDIGMELFGKPVGGDLKVFHRIESPSIQRSRRIGISRAKDFEWRFFIAGNPFVSHGGD